jgi:hypothetical protein
MLRRADRPTRRRLERSEVYFPYFSLSLRFDDCWARELLDPLGIRATPISDYFETLIDFAEATRWGRAPITRAHARARIERAAPTRDAVTRHGRVGAIGPRAGNTSLRVRSDTSR